MNMELVLETLREIKDIVKKKGLTDFEILHCYQGLINGHMAYMFDKIGEKLGDDE